MNAAPDDHPGQPAIVLKLAALRETRTKQVKLATEEQATAARLDAALRTPPGETSQVNKLTHGLSGTRAELDAMIKNLRADLEASGQELPGRLVCLSVLGYALQTRYDRFGELADLDAAVQMMADWLNAAPAANENRVMQEGMLAKALQERYWHRQSLDDLDAAITGWETAAKS